VTTAGRKSFAVGLVVSLSAFLIGVGVFLVGSEQRLWEGRTSFQLHFSRTNGLQESATVSLDGVAVGKVAAMRFPKDPSAHYVEVEIYVSNEVLPRMRRDSTGRIQTYGLLGDKYIELTSGSPDAEPLLPSALITTIDPVDYEAIFGRSGDIVADAIEVTGLLKEVLSEINRGEGVLGRFVRDRELGEQIANDLSSTAEHLESATRSVDELVAEVRAGKGNLGALVSGEQRVSAILENLDTASRDARSFVDKLNGSEGTIPRLVNDKEFADQTLASVTRASSSIAEVAVHVRAGNGTLGKLVYDPKLYEDAERWLGGGSSGPGGFWRLLAKTFTFFLPPLPKGKPEAPAAEASTSTH
jgi:phospholipid/cholesterol/gamma-HCH transport system substrate-binding protein